MKKTILYGNGVNLLGGGPSWDGILKLISKRDSLPQIQSNTLKYEYIILPQEEGKAYPLKHGRSLLKINGSPASFRINTEEKLKKSLSAELLKRGPSYFYDKLAELDADNYITTNYELFLPQKFGISLQSSETDLIYKHLCLDKDGQHKTFWNIHGDTSSPKDIILGLSDYCKYVAKINGYLGGLNKKTVPCWIDLLFNTDVHILGLGMGYEEVDLWNVLTTRKRNKRSNPGNCKNRIYYYVIRDKSYDSGKMELLKALDVNVVDVEFDNSDKAYINAYENIFRLIKNA